MNEMRKSFNKVTADWFIEERRKKRMTQKKFGELTNTNFKTVNKRETDGLNNLMKLTEVMILLGYDPVEKIGEIIKQTR